MYYATQAAADAIRAELRRPNQSTGRDNLVGLIALLVVVVLALAGCGTSEPVTSPVTEDQAIEIADNALVGYNLADYEVWTRDWSQTMTAAIGPEAFVSFQEEYHAVLGDYVAITGAEGGQGADAGTYRWTFDVQFENAEIQMILGFKAGSPLIEGVRFADPAAT